VATALLAIALVATTADHAWGLTPGVIVEVAGPGTTALTPVQPCRLFDSRSTPDLGRLDANTWRVPVANRCGVPADARAVAVGVVAVEAKNAGFLTVWPARSARPEVSNLNVERGNTVANAAVVLLGDGALDVYISAAAAVIIDVTGVFRDATTPSSGRFVAGEPTRLVDTRQSAGRSDTGLLVPLPPGVPPDATALAVSVTAVEAAAPGFLSAYPAGSPRPDTSVVNTDALNPTRASATFVPITPDGFVVYRSMTTDVIVDLWGWFTGPSAPPGTDGLFVPQAPVRVWDSRNSHDPLHAGGTLDRSIAPVGATAVVANVTAVEPTGAGFVSVAAAGVPRPDVSSLNYRWRQPVAALTVTRMSDRGVGFSSYAGTHLLVDVAGWFTGTPVAATLAPPRNDPPAGDRPVLVVSDSAFSGIRWQGALGWLQGARFDNRLESCRRLVGTSCRGREGYAPPTALAEIASVPAGAYRTLVVATGYNDFGSTFSLAVDAIVSAARSKGIERIVWLTYRENVGYVSPAAISNRDTFISHNAHLRAAVASGRYPDLILADWHSYTVARSGWLTIDGVHLTADGAQEAARYLSRKLAALERQACPAGGPTTPGGWCADPDVTGPP
jgi:hypothetical protein